MELLEKLDQDLLERLQSVTVIRPGDRLVFQVNRVLTQPEAQKIKGQIKAVLGDDLRFLVTGKDLDSYVIRAES